MDPLLHMISLLSAQAVAVLFSAIWEGAVLAACVALCLRVLPGLSAAARSLVWANVFLLLVLLHVLPSLGRRWPTSAGLHRSLFNLDPRWGIVVAGGWAVLSLWRGSQLVLEAIRSHGLAVRATPIRTDAALQTLLQVKRGGRTGRTAEFCTSVEIERPCVFGFNRPRILVPRGLLEQFTSEDLQQVVMHEMEHLRRADDWANLLQKTVLVLFPLNPVLLWVERRLCGERDLACDDRVLNSTGARKAYATCLTRMAEYSISCRSLSLALGAWEKRSELVRRIHRILRRPAKVIGRRRAAVLTVGLIAGVLAGAVALARSPQLLSFSPHPQSTMQAHSFRAAGLEEINAREFSGSPKLVKAVMPQKPSQSPFSPQHRRPAAKRSVGPSDRLPIQASTFVVLTGWEDSGPAPRIVLAVFEDRRSSYAAVALANGWLIVQI